MSFLTKPDSVATITNPKLIPEDWFITISDLNKPEIKNYMPEDFRKKALHGMVTTMVKEEEKKRGIKQQK